MQIVKKCPNCGGNITLENDEVLYFQYRGEVVCSSCGKVLEVSITNAILVSVVFGILIGFAVGSLADVSVWIVIFTVSAASLLFQQLFELMLCKLSISE